jgi:hypothetical protein
MDIYARRRLRLEQILTERYPGRGGRSALAARLERQPGYVSRCLGGGKRIGEAFARHVELRLQLPAFWLDGLPEPDQWLSARQLELLRGFAELTAEQQDEVMTAVAETSRRNRAVYEHLARRLAADGAAD